MDNEKIKAIMVSKTHWDREHSRPFEQFRWHLVYNVIDKLLNTFDTVPEYKSYMFDGQSLGILDYLDIRSEEESHIKKYVQEGKLVVGPFFVGPDEFIPSGESLIRNLLEGHKIANKFGGVMKVGYNPDAFGHISQLPQILRGFSISSAVFSRGVGEDIGRPGTDFIWESPDGSSVLAVYVNYGNATHLPKDLESAKDRIKQTVDSMMPKDTPFVLLINGSDGSVPEPHVPEIIKYANEKLEKIEVKHGTLQEYVDLVYTRSENLKRHSGELRLGRYNLILSGVYSSRTYLKQANAKTQTLLEKYAEPLATYAWVVKGDDYPSPFFERAWRFLLQNHFHDTICACSQDKVYHDAMQRYANSQQIAEKLIERSIKVITREINTAETGIANASALIVLNSLSHERKEIATKRMYTPVEADGRLQSYVVRDSEGNLVPFQIRNQKVIESFQPNFWERQYPYGKRLREFDVSFMANSVPSYGYKTYYLCPESSPSPKTDLKILDTEMENKDMKVKLNPNGTIDLTDKLSGNTYSGLHFFEDEESACGEYNHWTTVNPQIINSLSQNVRISKVESGPVCGTFKIDIDMLIPEGLSDDLQRRSEKLVNCPITTYVTLNAGSRVLRFRTIVQNNAKDHRLRVRFPTNISTDHVHAEGQFHILERNIKLPNADSWVEKPVPESPHQTFATISDSSKGITMINRGLVEYFAEESPNGVALSLTLLRGVGWIGREFFVTATYKIPTPDAQCLGTQEFEYAIYPHSKWESAKPWIYAHNFNAPLEVIETDLHSGNLPASFSLFSIEPDEVVVSAVKKAENDSAMIVRMFNISDRQVVAKITAFKPIKSATLVNMLEEPLEDLSVSNNSLSLPLKRNQIVTLKLIYG
ncbi:MAG: glycoside hydrolase family 38 C-terminal domain-containing protein [Candidatus Poribacteria bacterium]